MNLRERILNAKDIQSERVTVPEWDNVELEVRGMMLRDRNRIIRSIPEKNGERDPAMLAAVILIETVYDPESGQRVFTESDRDALLGKNARVVDHVTKVAVRLVGLDADDSKNGSGANGTTSTASPETSEEPSPS